MSLHARSPRRTRPAILGATALALAAALTVSTQPSLTTDADAPVAQHTAGDPAHARRTYRIVADTRTNTVGTGRTIRVVGSVTTASSHARRVALTERHAGHWRVIARKRSTRNGAYSFAVRAGRTRVTRVFRVRADRFRGLPAATTQPFRVKVVASPAPATPAPVIDLLPDAAEALPAGFLGAGSASDWTYLFPDGSRWNPCSVIRWTYDPAGQKYAALADVSRAFAKIAGASGLKFTYVGSTSWRYLGSLDAGFPSAKADIAVSWANATELPKLAGDVVGYGGGQARSADAGADVRYVMTRGYLALDKDAVLPTGFDRSGWGQVMMHEILHSLGLGHAAGAVQLMYGAATSKNIRFGAGDLRGMAKIGAAAGCLS